MYVHEGKQKMPVQHRSKYEISSSKKKIGNNFAGLTTSNANNSAYTRAEKFLNF